jgi:hypothetical protein
VFENLVIVITFLKKIQSLPRRCFFMPEGSGVKVKIQKESGKGKDKD